MHAKLRLNLLGTLNSVDYGGKVHQEGVTNGFDDVAMMHNDSLRDDLIMDVEQPQHAAFIRAHLAAETNNIGEHDGGQPSLLGARYATYSLLHKQGLFCR
jgi:hypothetical protein